MVLEEPWRRRVEIKKLLVFGCLVMLSRGRQELDRLTTRLDECLRCTSFVVNPNSRQPYAFGVVLILGIDFG